VNSKLHHHSLTSFDCTVAICKLVFVVSFHLVSTTMLRQDEASLAETTAELCWSPSLKIGSVVWNIDTKHIKTIGDEHFVKIHHWQRGGAIKKMISEMADGAVGDDFDLSKSKGFKSLLELREEAVQAVELAQLPKWQADAIASDPNMKKQQNKKRLGVDAVPRVVELQLDIEGVKNSVTTRVLEAIQANDVTLFVQINTKQLLAVFQFIIDKGFDDDTLTRRYARSALPRGITKINPSNRRRTEGYKVKIPRSAIQEAQTIDSSKRTRKSVCAKSIEEAKRVLQDPMSFVWQSAADDDIDNDADDDDKEQPDLSNADAATADE
jgi:hypothetical protein